ncbi:Spy/CpxP family protein refolding chaperone [Cesiribacter andamanensis]|uniref:Periplasmic repressor CpxP n=1 Tax=Cesiribacter andamanensis AMV16 TaxID=1279009 RepID=M7N3T2_9BACT|nr:Spy/CpxP family protein refolding chaperone [Cesiribacter andamanensis]EMR01952.1 periplasmic repressor CpxP [Cesiribacter andamanensis AMV16]
MKKMKMIVAAAFLFLSVTAFAQTSPQKSSEKPTKEHYKKGHKRAAHAGVNIDEWASKLDLTASQVTQWKALQEAGKTQMHTLKANTELSREEKKAQMKNLRQQNRAELQKILTTEQWAQYQELRKAEREARQAQAGDRKGKRPAKGERK